MRARSAFPVLVLLIVLVSITGYGSAAGSAPSRSMAQPSPAADTAFRSSPMMVIENAGQWPAAARFQVWGGPAGTMWLAEDAIWITKMGRGEASRTAPSPSVADSVGMLRPNTANEAPPARGVTIKITFPGANPHPRLDPVERLDTKVSYFLGNDPVKWRSEVPAWGGVRYVDLYPGVDLIVGADGAGDDALSPLWALQARAGAETSVVKVRIEGADSVTVAGGQLQLAAEDREIRLPLPGADFSYLLNGNVVDGWEIGQDITAQAEAAADNPADLIFSTFLGGSDYDYSSAIVVDAAGRVYISGNTYSGDFPTTPGAFDTSYNGGQWGDVFVVRLNANGTALEYATFLGGSDNDGGTIAVDVDGRVYVAGTTQSSNFPTTLGAFDTTYNGGQYGDAFVVRLNATGSALEYATFLGGSGTDNGYGIALGADALAYVTGSTWSSDFPTTPGAFDITHNGGQWDAYVVKLNANGSALEYSTFLGGTGNDAGYGMTVDAAGQAYVIGDTSSNNFPTTPGAFDTSFNGGYYGDAFVVRLNANGSAMEYSTFLGGSESDNGRCIVLDSAGRAYISGGTRSNDFPTTPGAFDTSFNGGLYGDAFVIRLNANGSQLEYSTLLGGSNSDYGDAIAVDATGRAYVTGPTWSSDFPTTPGAFDTGYNGGYVDGFVVRLNSNGGALEYATFLGGNGNDAGDDIVVNAAGRAYVTGYTKSDNFPTTSGAFNGSYNGGSQDTFVAKLAMGNGAEPTVTPTATTPPVYAPSGVLGDATCDVISGWAGDKDDPNRAVEVHLYADGTYSGGRFIAAVTADSPREAAVCSALGGANCGVCPADQPQCKHGFVLSKLPTWLRDGQAHSIYAYAINLSGTGGSGVAMLSGVPKTMQCQSTATPTHTATPTPTASPTSTPTTDPHSTPTATPEVTGSAVYLPLILELTVPG